MGEYADEAISRYFDNDDYLYIKYKPNLRDFPRKRKELKELIIRGKAMWAKVIGAPVWGYENAHKEWAIDVMIDEKTEAKLEAEGLGPIIKDKGKGKFVSFKRKEFKADGTPNKPIRIVDSKGETWGDAKIGNGSVVNVNFAINEYKKGKFSANILSLQVWEHVPYTGGEFPVKDDDYDAAGDDDWANEVED